MQADCLSKVKRTCRSQDRSPSRDFRNVYRSRFRSCHFPNLMLPATAWACFEGPFGELLRATGPMARANPFRHSTKYPDDQSVVN
jgi:hypothetical protein